MGQASRLPYNKATDQKIPSAQRSSVAQSWLGLEYIELMNANRQFSLAYLFFEVLLFAVAFGMLRFLNSGTLTPGNAFLIYPIFALIGAGIGGLVRQMQMGLIAGLVLAGFIALPLLLSSK